jgi:hypothetical protein
MCGTHAFDVFRSSSLGAIAMLAALLLTNFVAYLRASSACQSKDDCIVGSDRWQRHWRSVACSFLSALQS